MSLLRQLLVVQPISAGPGINAYRKSHEIDGTTEGEQTNYQMKIKVYYESAQYLNTFVKDGDNPLVDPGDDRVWPAIVHSGGLFHLYMGSPDDYSEITYWTSADGKTFVEHGSSPVITRARVETAWSLLGVPLALEPHSIIWWEGEWRMYFGVKNSVADGSGWTCGCATSSDLENWALGMGPVLEPDVAWETDSCADPHAVIWDGKVYLYYAGRDAPGWKLGVAWSDDGDTFTKSTSNPLTDYASAPMAFFPTSTGISGLIQDRVTAGYPYQAVWSKDGETLRFYSGNPVFEREVGIAWEAANLAHADIVLVGSTYWLYYNAKDVGDNFRMGRASTTNLLSEKTEPCVEQHGREDFGDIRFMQGAVELDYWLQEKVDGEYAIFWVEIPTIPASPGSTTIHIYYGKADATTTESGADTWITYEDWESYDDGDPLPLGEFEAITVEEVLEVDINRAFKGVQSLYSDDDAADKLNSFDHNYADIVAGGVRFLIAVYQDTDYGTTDSALSIIPMNDTPAGVISLYVRSKVLQDYYGAGYHTIAAFDEDEWHVLEICAVIGDPTWDLVFDEVAYSNRTPRRALTILTATRIIMAGNVAKFRGNLGVCCKGKYVDPEPTHGAWGSEEGIVWPF